MFHQRFVLNSNGASHIECTHREGEGAQLKAYICIQERVCGAPPTCTYAIRFHHIIYLQAVFNCQHADIMDASEFEHFEQICSSSKSMKLNVLMT